MPIGFFDSRHILRDTVTIYDAPTSEGYAGGVIGGTTVVASAVAALVAPLTMRETQEIIGTYPSTVARLYAGTAVVVYQRSRVEINESVSWGTGTMFIVEADPMIYYEPFTPHALYQTAWLSEIQR